MLLTFLAIILFSCEKQRNQSDIRVSPFEHEIKKESQIKSKKRNCATMKVLQEKLRKDPKLKEKMDKIHKHSIAYSNAKSNKKPKNNGGDNEEEVSIIEGKIKIPVVVHVIYNTDIENISDLQIESQMNVLNNDFNALNTDLANTPVEFIPLVANSEIEFELYTINRVYSDRTSWGTGDDMKYTSKGGIDAWDANKYLNIWICNIGGGILGFAQFPGGELSTDGIVVSPQYFGTIEYVEAPFDKGRTATHEIGHWLNLRHIWGDGKCNRDDFITDTPNSSQPNFGCPSYPTISCKSTDLTMNFMDYVHDECMYMFTNGQAERMRSLFSSGGIKESFIPINTN